MAERFLLPDPWSPPTTNRVESFGAPTAYVSATWPVANLAIYMPVIFPADCTLYSLNAVGNNATGNYDLGFYSPAFARLASKGTTANAAAVLTLSLPNIRVAGGDVYYAAITFSSTSSALVAGGVAGLFAVIAGFAQQATALPLPSPGVPATFAQAIFPLFTFGIR